MGITGCSRIAANRLLIRNRARIAAVRDVSGKRKRAGLPASSRLPYSMKYYPLSIEYATWSDINRPLIILATGVTMNRQELRRIAEEARVITEREKEAARTAKQQKEMAQELERARQAIRDLDATLERVAKTGATSVLVYEYVGGSAWDGSDEWRSIESKTIWHHSHGISEWWGRRCSHQCRAEQVLVKAPEFALLVYNECKSRGFKPYWEEGSPKWTLSVWL
jgi:hypothetical protein